MSKLYNFNKNHASLAGRLTSDPKYIKYDDSSNRCIYFTLAVNRFNKRQDGSVREETLFMDVQAWNRMADIMKDFLKKGSEIQVNGHLELYTDKKENRSVRLVAEDFLPGPNTYNAIFNHSSVSTTSDNDTTLVVSESGSFNYNK